MSMMPYRNAELAKQEEKPKPLYGLLKASKKHQCKLPGFWYRFFFRVNENSLYRCHCGDVYTLRQRDGDIICSWTRDYKEAWIALGGRLEP